jgi:L-alanine-DL-glutamate epimerase-like enolase superfamily enzyme
MLTVRTVAQRFDPPLRAAWGELRERTFLHARLDFGPGDWGEGEAAPLEPYDGVPLAAVRAALDAYARIDAAPDELLAACAAERDLPQALAAIDLALWDRRSRLERAPIARLIAPAALDAVPVNATIGAQDRAGAAAAAAAAARAGFGCVKVKVGVGDDAGRLAAVRAAASGLLIRIDANGAWVTPDEALAHLRMLAPTGIELCEEPVHGIEGLRAVRAESPVPIAMDETDAPGAGAADYVVLKITRGGITGVLDAARAARAAGSRVYVASTFDGPLGLAAGVHVAAALRPDAPCGLPASGRGMAQVPERPGLRA